MSTLAYIYHFALLIACGNTLIIPEELPSILSVIYSNIPPIKKGTDSRVGVGFRLGDHADFQVLLELGPQLNTQPLGPDGDTKKRRQVQRPAPITLPVTGSETIANTPGGKWLSSWRSALVNFQSTTANKYSAVGQEKAIMNPMEGKEHVISQLQQLYKNGSKAIEESNTETATKDSEPVGKSSMTSAET